MIGATMAYYNLTFNVIGATMAYYNFTFNMIGATMGGPSQNPLAYLYKPRVCGNKAELLRRTPVASDCLSLQEGLGWRTAGSPLLGTPRLCWGKFHCLSLSAERPPQFATRIHRFCIQLSYPLVSVERILFTMCQVLLWESLLKLGHSSYPQGSPAEEEDIKIIINIYWGKYNNRTCILFVLK